MHGENTKRALFAIAFRDVDTTRRLWVVPSLPQRVHGLGFLFGCFPSLPINTGRSFASVFGHSSHSKGFAAQRMGQQVLQSFDLAPLAF